MGEKGLDDLLSGMTVAKLHLFTGDKRSEHPQVLHGLIRTNRPIEEHSALATTSFFRVSSFFQAHLMENSHPGLEVNHWLEDEYTQDSP